MNRPLNPWKLTGYKAGQNVVCKVVQAEPGGYAVNIPKDNLPGFLPTDQKLKVGEEVLAQFVCVHNNRVLLSSRLSGTQLSQSTYRPGQAQVSWQEQMSDGGAAAHQASEPEAAFQVWAQAQPVNFKLRRAIDLILPSIGGENPNNFVMGDEDLDWLIIQLEGGMRTGCVKAFSETKKSRSAVLLYRGRAVGCIYGNKTLSEPQPTEPSLQMMLNDLSHPETSVLMYDLPEDVTLAMSALFLGYPVERSDDLDARSYMDYICSWLAQKEQTACLAFNLPSKSATCLAFIHRGRYVGSFYVEDQNYSDDINFVYNLLQQDPQARVEASILPPEMTSSSVRFGFSLSMAKPRA
jgi:hypothetical protein